MYDTLSEGKIYTDSISLCSTLFENGVAISVLDQIRPVTRQVRKLFVLTAVMGRVLTTFMTTSCISRARLNHRHKKPLALQPVGAHANIS